jgi:hypothetical protein
MYEMMKKRSSVSKSKEWRSDGVWERMYPALWKRTCTKVSREAERK